MENEKTIRTMKAAAGGDQEARADLWKRYRPFIYYQANRRKAAASANGYGWIIDADDLAQSGYFALIKAAETFDQAKGKAFLSWLAMHLLSAFNDTFNVRTVRGRRDPAQYADSLDQIIPGTDDVVILDMIPDPADPFADFIQADYQRSIFEMIEDAIGAIDAPELTRDLLLEMLRHGFNCEIFEAYKTAGGELTGRPEYDKQRARNIYKQGIAKLRRELMKSGRKKLYKDYYFPDAYRGSGFRAWNSSGLSVVERIAFKRDEMLKRWYE